jgi:hypothetical protein
MADNTLTRAMPSLIDEWAGVAWSDGEEEALELGIGPFRFLIATVLDPGRPGSGEAPPPGRTIIGNYVNSRNTFLVNDRSVLYGNSRQPRIASANLTPPDTQSLHLTLG